MKRDGRKLDYKTLEEIRRMAVERGRAGEDSSTVIASYGFCRRTIYKGLRAVKGRGRGFDALRSRKGTATYLGAMATLKLTMRDWRRPPRSGCLVGTRNVAARRF